MCYLKVCYFISKHLEIFFPPRSFCYWKRSSCSITDFWFISVVIREHPRYNLNPFDLLRIVLWPGMWSFLAHLNTHIKRMGALLWPGWCLLSMSLRSSWLIVSIKLSTSPMIFCLLALSVIEKGLSKSLPVIVDLSISRCHSVIFWFMYFEELLLGM